MKISCLQMNMMLGCPNGNFAHAKQLIQEAMKEKPDVLVLPETWNTGFIPQEDLSKLSDRDGQRTKEEIGALANAYHVNIVAGSVSNLRQDRIFNTSMVFNKQGECVASYDKIHLFSPMGEDRNFARGDHISLFSLDGMRCGVIVCYDLRFPELTRKMAVQGLDVLFVVSQWPKVRRRHLQALAVARAIENQMYVVCCNSCGVAGKTIFGGGSMVVDPMGMVLAQAGEKEEILLCDISGDCLVQIRDQIPVFRDRIPELYAE